jgi:threonine synthase
MMMPQAGLAARGSGPVAYARHTDTRTSHEAANSLSGKTLTKVQRAVALLLSRHGPLTDEELIAIYRELESREGTQLPGASDSSIRTRRKELVDVMMVHDCGKKHSETGRLTTMWGTKRPGRR